METVIKLLSMLALMHSDACRSEMVPPAWEIGSRIPPTRRAHDHDWQTGPRGGVFYYTDHGTKVYRKKK